MNMGRILQICEKVNNKEMPFLEYELTPFEKCTGWILLQIQPANLQIEKQHQRIVQA